MGTLYTSLKLRGQTAELSRSDFNRQVIRFTQHALQILLLTDSEVQRLRVEINKKGRAVSVLPRQEKLTKFRDMCLSSNSTDFAMGRRSSKTVLEEFEFDTIIGYIF